MGDAGVNSYMAGGLALKQPPPPPSDAADAPFVGAKISVWWDIENCHVPRDSDPHAIAQNISSALAKLNYCGPISISAYGDTTNISPLVQQALNSTGVALNHVPAGVKDASDKKILVDMLFWAVDNPAPATYLLISGDRDFSNALHQLRMRRYTILLAQPKKASAALVAAAKTVWLWTSLLTGGLPLSHTTEPKPFTNISNGLVTNSDTSAMSASKPSQSVGVVHESNLQQGHGSPAHAPKVWRLNKAKELMSEKNQMKGVKRKGSSQSVGIVYQSNHQQGQGPAAHNSRNHFSGDNSPPNPHAPKSMVWRLSKEKELMSEKNQKKGVKRKGNSPSKQPSKKTCCAANKTGPGHTHSKGCSNRNTKCANCKKNHFGKCNKAPMCFHCGDSGHLLKDCHLTGGKAFNRGNHHNKGGKLGTFTPSVVTHMISGVSCPDIAASQVVAGGNCQDVNIPGARTPSVCYMANEVANPQVCATEGMGGGNHQDIGISGAPTLSVVTHKRSEVVTPDVSASEVMGPGPSPDIGIPGAHTCSVHHMTSGVAIPQFAASEVMVGGNHQDSSISGAPSPSVLHNRNEVVSPSVSANKVMGAGNPQDIGLLGARTLSHHVTKGVATPQIASSEVMGDGNCQDMGISRAPTQSHGHHMTSEVIIPDDSASNIVSARNIQVIGISGAQTLSISPHQTGVLATHNKLTPRRFCCGEIGHLKKDCELLNGGSASEDASQATSGGDMSSGNCNYSGLTRDQTQRCLHCGEFGHLTKDCQPSIGRSTRDNVIQTMSGGATSSGNHSDSGLARDQTLRCYRCGEFGHLKKDCLPLTDRSTGDVSVAAPYSNGKSLYNTTPLYDMTESYSVRCCLQSGYSSFGC